MRMRRRYIRRRPRYRRKVRRSRTFRKKRIYRKAVKKLQPLTIQDRTVVEVKADANGNVAVAVNLNGAPGRQDESSMVCRVRPITPEILYYNFKKFKNNKLNHVWEQCRCVWLKLKWFPYRPNDGSSVAVYTPAVVIRERDGIDWSPSSTFPDDTTIYYEPSFKAYNWYRPFTIFQRCVPYGFLSKVPPYPTSSVFANTGANIHGQWHGMDASLGRMDDANSEHIYIRFKDAPVNGVLGTFIVTAKFQCKGSYYSADT